jgi:hypothetical protein
VFSIPEPGNYVVRRSYRLVAESGEMKSSADEWRLEISWPRSVVPLSVDSIAYFGESPVIAFATREFSDARAYSYSIWQVNGSRVDTGSGSTIFLSSIVNDPKNTVSDYGKEKRFEVRGYYNGQIFSYVNPGDSVVHSSKWRFKISKPVLDPAVMWESDIRVPVDSLPMLPMDLKSAYNPALFSFIYLGKKGGALIVTTPKISNLNVESDPPEFLTQNPQAYMTSMWTDIVIAPNAAFLRSGPANEPKLVTLKFTFDTQLEKRVTKVYRALVY